MSMIEKFIEFEDDEQAEAAKDSDDFNTPALGAARCNCIVWATPADNHG